MVELFPETLPLTFSSIMACEHTTHLHTCIQGNTMKLQKTLKSLQRCLLVCEITESSD